jgi:hypothetical protein
MPRHPYTPAKYALQRVIVSFSNLLMKLAEPHSTHTYAVVFRFCQLESIDYLIVRYLNTSALPFTEFSEEWLHGRKI